MADNDPQPHTELASFGDELRREREIRGISLKEIADATKISKRFLEAIERNDHRTLPAPVFTRGFVREYARYVGLNAEDMVNRYNFAAAGDDRVEKTPQLERLVQPVLQRESPRPQQQQKGIPPPYARIDRNVYITIVIIVALLGATYWAIQNRRASRAAAAEALRLEREALAPPPDPGATSTEITSTESATTTDQAPPDSETLRLALEITDDSWVTLEADGNTVVNREMRRGERRTFEAKEQFRFRTVGNAAGVSVTLNDAKLPPLGEDGEVVKNRILNRETLKNLEPRRTSSSTSDRGTDQRLWWTLAWRAS